MNQNIRRNRLRLLSSLYEVAARFTEKELIEIRDDEEGDTSTRNFAGLMLRLHSAGRASGSDLRQKSETPVVGERLKARVSTPRRREVALREILMSSDLFNGPSDIAAAIPVPIKLRHKESRVRYINRVVDAFRRLPDEGQIDFVRSIQERLSSKDSGSFVNRWSKLIRDL